MVIGVFLIETAYRIRYIENFSLVFSALQTPVNEALFKGLLLVVFKE